MEKGRGQKRRLQGNEIPEQSEGDEQIEVETVLETGGEEVDVGKNHASIFRNGCKRQRKSISMKEQLMGEGGREAQRSVPFKRKSRYRVDRRKFQLTETTRGNGDGYVRLRSEDELNKDAFRVSQVMVGFMTEEWVEVTQLRCVHIKEKRRKIIVVCP